MSRPIVTFPHPAPRLQKINPPRAVDGEEPGPELSLHVDQVSPAHDEQDHTGLRNAESEPAKAVPGNDSEKLKSKTARKPVRQRRSDAPPSTRPESKANLRAESDGGASHTTSKDSEPTQFRVTKAGVHYVGDDDRLNWICSPIELVALVRDKRSGNWGRLFEFADPDGKIHRWVIPMELLRGNGEELRGSLLRMGLRIAPGAKARSKLLEFITTEKTNNRVRIVDQTGWYGDVFVLPDRAIGDIDEKVIYQDVGEQQESQYACSGTLEDWRKNVGALCVGNSRLMLATSCAFAAPLLNHSATESRGINLVGESSTGKTTALRVAASVYGPPKYVQRWRSTDNGIEGLAALHSGYAPDPR